MITTPANVNDTTPADDLIRGDERVVWADAAYDTHARRARLKAEGRPALEAACMAKLFASEAAEAICTASIQTLGGYGYLSDYPVERIYRDVRVCQIYEGTSDVQKLILQRML